MQAGRGADAGQFSISLAWPAASELDLAVLLLEEYRRSCLAWTQTEPRVARRLERLLISAGPWIPVNECLVRWRKPAESCHRRRRRMWPNHSEVSEPAQQDIRVAREAEQAGSGPAVKHEYLSYVASQRAADD
jgi:hypothetical protein